ncbi:hypothetical protein QVD17_27755 [Tagetes erecta]|uniref:Uncharacterized protein n=1 Tax=Tagetes erecta TaxID=13708 RepID=A0AAD8K932_TARER|nr:hypothetical protein QVD17_27755 [Tagetes erecta]
MQCVILRDKYVGNRHRPPSIHHHPPPLSTILTTTAHGPLPRALHSPSIITSVGPTLLCGIFLMKKEALLKTTRSIITNPKRSNKINTKLIKEASL